MSDSSKIYRVSGLDSSETNSSMSRGQSKQESKKLNTSVISTAQSKNTSLKDYNNPASLVTLQFSNRGEKSLRDISLFKNLVNYLPGGHRLIWQPTH